MDINTCLEECKRIAQITEKYASCCSMFDEMSVLVTDKMFGTGGEGCHRGYYCPSKIIDIVTNVKRGRTMRKQPSALAYIYGFDSSGRLITVETSHSREFMIYKHGKELGITFNNRFGDISTISESVYDEAGRIKLYSLYVCNGMQHSVVDFTREIYTYSTDQLLVDSYRFSNSKREPILGHTRYVFQVQNDILLSYTCEEYKDGNRIPSAWDGHIFNVNLERKI